MADNTSNLRNDNRRERAEASANSADIVAAGMAAAGIGLILATDDAAAHMKAAVDPDRRATDRDITNDSADAPAADHAAHGGVPNDVTTLAADDASPVDATAIDRPVNADLMDGTDVASDRASAVTNSDAGIDTVGITSSTSEAVPSASSGGGATPLRGAEAVSHSAHDGLDTVNSVVTSTLDQIDATIASATDNIAAVSSSINTTVSNLADTLSGFGQSIISHVADLPSTLLGAQPAVAAVDHVFADAFQDSPVADVANSIGSFGLTDSLPGFEDFTPINLGFIGQSYTDQIELGGHTPGGLLHGLV